MITAIIFITLSFIWLLIETDFLTVRLPVGKFKPTQLLLPAPKPILMLPLGITYPKYARYQVYHSLKGGLKNAVRIHEGSNIPEGEYPSNVANYQIYLSPGIEPMCGYDWLDKHCADMVDFKQHIEMNLGNVRYTMNIKTPEIMSEIMKANKLSKQEKQKIIAQHLHDNPLLDYGNKVIRRKSKKLVKV